MKFHEEQIEESRENRINYKASSGVGKAQFSFKINYNLRRNKGLDGQLEYYEPWRN